MSCTDYKATILVDGVPMSSSKDNGCLGDKHTFSATTTLPTPVTYAWSLDGLAPVLSTSASYAHTFGSTKQVLYLVVRNDSCGIQKTVTLSTRECKSCPIVCTSQTVSFPAGTLIKLIDSENKQYTIDTVTTTCTQFDKSNTTAAKAVVRAISQSGKCQVKLLNAQIYANESAAKCNTLTITNSPIIFKQIEVSNKKYTFDASRCVN